MGLVKLLVFYNSVVYELEVPFLTPSHTSSSNLSYRHLSCCLKRANRPWNYYFVSPFPFKIAQKNHLLFSSATFRCFQIGILSEINFVALRLLRIWELSVTRLLFKRRLLISLNLRTQQWILSEQDAFVTDHTQFPNAT